MSVFLVMLVQRLSSLSVWDDAYMFVRYADNFVNFGSLTWNPQANSTYGLTSLAYLIIVIPLRMIFQTEPALVMILSSLLSGLLALLTMIWLLHRLVTNTVHRQVMWIVLSLSSVVAADSIVAHLTSGMDTTFAIFVITVWLGVVYTSTNYGLMGVLSGLFFAVRPDLLIVPLLTMPVLLFKGDSYSQLLKYSFGMTIAILFQITATFIYFGTPLPLSFYAKNISVYSEQFYSYYTNTSWGYFLEFVRSYPYLLGIIVISLVTRFRSWQWQDRGLLLGCIAFCIYHIAFVVPIMGFSQRFFYPVMPLLIILASRGLVETLNRLPNTIIETLQTYPLRVLFVPLLLIFAFINPMPIILSLVQYTQPASAPTIGIGRFDLQTAYDYLYIDNWYALDELSKLNDDIVIATTEIGLPGVMNPRKTIIDMAGLNDLDIALNGFSAEWLMADKNQPDWIYMPFPHYEGMWYAIFNHAVFKDEYQFFTAQSLGTSMDVAVKRDSKFYSIMIELFNNL